ncbi:hypothetical protein [Aquabacterium sp.]|uniref:hypothetical protein n=1 Tax=Aquabacterium sp. TaxID=1872578 RepID=UPI0019B31BCF|nr:hypothetical protein [Aquabacterium sp.]MBC7701739.1 hypothetical protein [Aquabacterium sp.]
MSMHGSAIWQDLVALGIVLTAAAYLGRRWWPTLASLLGLKTTPAAAKAACGQANGACQQCGSSGAAPQRDHRIKIVRPRQ